jgi:hypothetical protein
LVSDNSDILTRVAEGLLEYETLTAGQVQTLVEGGALEPRVPTLKVAKADEDVADETKPETEAAEAQPDADSVQAQPDGEAAVDSVTDEEQSRA